MSSHLHLAQLCRTQQWRDAASALQAVDALLGYFAPFERLPLVVQQRAEIHALRARLEQQVRDTYEHAFAPAAAGRARTGAGTLADAAHLADALGGTLPRELVDAYCARQLREYRRVFRPGDEAGQLDNVPRRYAWLRRMLRTLADEHASAFLPAWHAAPRLVGLFVEATHDDLKSALVRAQPQLDADTLLAALHATHECEAQLQKQLGDTPVPVPPERAMSAAFAPYLGVFVDAQDAKLAAMLARWADAPPGADERVLASSTELVAYYRQTLERCAQLGPHAPLRALAHVYARGLKRYAADVLTPALQTRDVRHLCVVLNTAEYGATTCTQLAERLTDKCRAQNGATISLDAEREAFLAVVGLGLQSLVRALHAALEPAFQQLVRPDVPWAQRDSLTERPAWLGLLASALESVGVVVRHDIDNKRYVRAWCDKAATLVATRWLQAVLRLRPVRRLVAQQLRHDTAQLVQCLYDLPHWDAPAPGPHDDARAPSHAAYRRLVDRAVGRVTPVLEVLAADDAPPALVDAYRTHVADQSLPNFQKILDLKGIRRVEQTPWVEEFLAAIDRAPDALPTSSALSAMPIDPNAPAYAMPELGDRPHDAPDEQRAGTPARPGTPSSVGSAVASASASLSLPDWKKFGSMFGAALGQRRP